MLENLAKVNEKANECVGVCGKVMVEKEMAGDNWKKYGAAMCKASKKGALSLLLRKGRKKKENQINVVVGAFEPFSI